MSKISCTIFAVLVALGSAIFVMHNALLIANSPDPTQSSQEQQSSRVEMDEIPRAIRKTIKREAFGGRVIEVEKEYDDGKLYYEAEVVIGSYIYDVAVNEKGILLAKVMDRPLGKEDGDDEDGDDEDGDDEDGDDEDGDDEDGDDEDGDDEDGDDEDGDDDGDHEDGDDDDGDHDDGDHDDGDHDDGDHEDGDDDDGDDDDGYHDDGDHDDADDDDGDHDDADDDDGDHDYGDHNDGDHDDGDHDDGDDDDGDDEDLSMTNDQLPRAVGKTLKRETKGGELEELEKETEDGKVIYSAEVEYETEFGDLTYEIEIAADGVLLHKILENIERDSDEDDEDEDDEDDQN